MWRKRPQDAYFLECFYQRLLRLIFRHSLSLSLTFSLPPFSVFRLHLLSYFSPSLFFLISHSNVYLLSDCAPASLHPPSPPSPTHCHFLSRSAAYASAFYWRIVSVHEQDHWWDQLSISSHKSIDLIPQLHTHTHTDSPERLITPFFCYFSIFHPKTAESLFAHSGTNTYLNAHLIQNVTHFLFSHTHAHTREAVHCSGSLNTALVSPPLSRDWTVNVAGGERNGGR